MKRHLLVTNDYPPKVGGIQSYLWELWKRLPNEKVTVPTPDHVDARIFDVEQGHSIVRDKRKVFLPTRSLAADIRDLAHQVDAELVILDPALPLGHLAPSLVSSVRSHCSRSRGGATWTAPVSKAPSSPRFVGRRVRHHSWEGIQLRKLYVQQEQAN